MITLSDSERQKFAQYAAQEAESYRVLSEQIDKLNIAKALLVHNKAIHAAYLLVAQHLTDVEKW